MALTMDNEREKLISFCLNAALTSAASERSSISNEESGSSFSSADIGDWFGGRAAEAETREERGRGSSDVFCLCRVMSRVFITLIFLFSDPKSR